MAKPVSELEELALGRGSAEAGDEELVQIEIPAELAEFLSSGGGGAEADNIAGGVQRFCRVCLHAAGHDMSSIFSGANDDQLAFMLTTFTRLQMVSGDGMPSKVCTGCRELIIQCYSFKQKCERSETALRAFLQGDIIYNIKSELDDLNVKTEVDVNFKSEEVVNMLCIDNQIENSDDCNSNGDVSEMSTSDVKFEINMELIKDEHGLFILDKHTLENNKRKSEGRNDGSSEQIQNSVQSKRAANNSQKKSKLMCGVCDKTYKDFNKLSHHMESHMLEKAEKCEYCGKNCKSDRGLQRHMVLVHGGEGDSDRPFKCPQCGSAFVSAKDLMIHSAVHSDLLSCNECRKEFTTLLQLKRHIKRHMDEKPHKCEICSKKFSEVFALHRHQRSHFGTVVEKKHVCTDCGKKFAEKSSLTVHSRLHTGERPYVCMRCGKNFLSTRLLNSHMRTHSDHKPHKCKLCDKSFRHTATLATHRRTHTGERPYVCSACGKTFIQSSNLTLHMRVHSGERPYSCSVCGNRFTSWSTMKAHERVHTGEKPYSCKICNQRFARMDMKAHMRRHTGERPYTCTLCDKSFFTSVRLNQHSRLHSGIKPFECGLCGLKMGAKSALLRHVKRHRLGNVIKISGVHKPKAYNILNIELNQNESTETSALQICDYVDGTETVIEQSGESKVEVGREVSMNIPDLMDALPHTVEVEMASESPAPAPTAALPPLGSTLAPRGRRLSVFQIRSSGGQIIMSKAPNTITNDCRDPQDS